MSIYDINDENGELICEFKGCYGKVVQMLNGQWCAKHRKAVKQSAVKRPANERLQEIAERAKESFRIERFVRYCQMEGLGSVDAEEDRYFTDEQAKFFAEYEKQMEWKSDLISHRQSPNKIVEIDN